MIYQEKNIQRLANNCYIAWLMVLCCLCGAQRMMAVNNLRLSIDGAYVHDFSKSSLTIPHEISIDELNTYLGQGLEEPLSHSNGANMGVGIGYRYAYNHFLLDIGIGAHYRYMNNGLSTLHVEAVPSVSPWGYNYDQYDTYSDRADNIHRLGLELPIMIGAEFGKVFFLVGAKGGYDLWGGLQEKCKFSREAVFEKYGSGWTAMPNHDLPENQPYKCDQMNIANSWDLRACAEVGYYLLGKTRGMMTSKPSPVLALSAFAEYTVLGSSSWQPLYAGVRLTVLFPSKPAPICKCLK